MSHEPHAQTRIGFGWFRGAQSPDPEDSFAVFWLQKRQEQFHAECAEHLDTILGEVCQMMVGCLRIFSADPQEGTKASFRADLQAHFPYAPPEDPPVTLDAVLAKAAAIPDLQRDWTSEQLAGLVVDRFAGWRDLPKAEFEILALRWMPLLLDQHEHLRATFVRTANCMGDREGYGFRDLRTWREEFRHRGVHRLPLTIQDS